ncbi:MAG: YraN family protein [Campylobacterota bacterium]|nr:YraN family protein [Campylobacterota bacterium]
MSRTKGDIAEERACEVLRKKGFSIIGRNYSSRFGEIDIIALKDKVLHFLEVKSAATYDQAIQNITPVKLQRILRTTDVYMKHHQLSIDYSIDAVVVTPKDVEIIENITL